MRPRDIKAWAKEACRDQGESKHLYNMLYTTILSALILAGSAISQGYDGRSECYAHHVSSHILTHEFLVEYNLPPILGACGRVCDGVFTCEQNGRAHTCSGGDAAIPAHIFYDPKCVASAMIICCVGHSSMNPLRYYNPSDPENSPICQSAVSGMLRHPRHRFPAFMVVFNHIHSHWLRVVHCGREGVHCMRGLWS
jgi:hypothetical protein